MAESKWNNAMAGGISRVVKGPAMADSEFASIGPEPKLNTKAGGKYTGKTGSGGMQQKGDSAGMANGTGPGDKFNKMGTDRL